MRKDQPKIEKELTKLNKELKDLRSAVKSLQKTITHRDNIIDDQLMELVRADEAILITRIEYERLFLDKPALTIPFALAREVLGLERSF